MRRPPFTFERNTLGSNGSFTLRFIAGPPCREVPFRVTVNVSPNGTQTGPPGQVKHEAGSCAPSDYGAHPRQRECNPAGGGHNLSPAPPLSALILTQCRGCCQ